MKLRKIWVYFLICVFSLPAIVSLSSCQTSYKNMRKFSKNQKTQSKRKKRHRSQRRAKRKAARPINTTYVVKSKRRTAFHY